MNNRGRIQAQGAGTEESSAWAQNDDMFKAQGIEHVQELRGMLTPGETNLRRNSLNVVEHRINNYPSQGVLPFKKSYWDNDSRKDIRVDIEVHAGIAFIDNLHNN